MRHLVSLTLFTVFTTPVCGGYCYANCDQSGVSSTTIVIIAVVIAVLVLLAIVSALVRYQRVRQYRRDLRDGALGSHAISNLHTSVNEPAPSYWRRHHRHHHGVSHSHMSSMQNTQSMNMSMMGGTGGIGGIGGGSGAIKRIRCALLAISSTHRRNSWTTRFSMKVLTVKYDMLKVLDHRVYTTAVVTF
ncbi:hypothetical protein EV361DRAFT_595827 [Lentinula raphanica]|nr:hypothetical protein EV361DRAFT_595827 [Lentinula raphanica]